MGVVVVMIFHVVAVFVLPSKVRDESSAATQEFVVEATRYEKLDVTNWNEFIGHYVLELNPIYVLYIITVLYQTYNTARHVGNATAVFLFSTDVNFHPFGLEILRAVCRGNTNNLLLLLCYIVGLQAAAAA